MLLLLLFLFSILDLTTPLAYTCDRRSTCGCSKRSTVILSKIINGEPVTKSQSWGWMASLRRNGAHECGASLIAPSYVITAAHCVPDIEFTFSLSLNFDTTNISNIGQLRYVNKIYIHPLYNEQLFTDDLAILRLDRPINLTNSNITTICLPSKSDFNLTNAEYPPEDESLIAIGWGSTAPHIRESTPILQQVTLKAVGRTTDACVRTIYNDTVQFCAGLPDGSKDTCQGDSGGPLMLFKNRKWQLVGITSYGESCAKANSSGVYTRIAYYESYIRNILKYDEHLISNMKNLKFKYKSNSSALISYQQSIIRLCFICLYFLSKKFSF